MGPLMLRPTQLLEPETRIRITQVVKNEKTDNPLVDGVMPRLEALKGQVITFIDFLNKVFGHLLLCTRDSVDLELQLTGMLSTRGCLFMSCKHHVSQKIEMLPGVTGPRQTLMNCLCFGPVIFNPPARAQQMNIPPGYLLVTEVQIVFEEAFLVHP